MATNEITNHGKRTGKRKQKKNSIAPLIGFNPVELYLQDLRSTFGPFAYFFRDSLGGTVIAVQWKTDIQSSQKFAPSKSAYTIPAEVEGRKVKSVQYNLPEILADMRRLGDGIVQTIHMSYHSFEKEYYG